MREAEVDRRAFLGWAATGAASLLLPSVIRPKPKVFDMGRGMRRPTWRPRALFLDRAGRVIHEAPMVAAGGGWQIEASAAYTACDRVGLDAVELRLEVPGGYMAERTPIGCTMEHGETIVVTWPWLRA